MSLNGFELEPTCTNSSIYTCIALPVFIKKLKKENAPRTDRVTDIGVAHCCYRTSINGKTVIFMFCSSRPTVCCENKQKKKKKPLVGLVPRPILHVVLYGGVSI